MDSAQANGRLEEWIANSTAGIEQIWRVHDYLRTREERTYWLDGPLPNDAARALRRLGQLCRQWLAGKPALCTVGPPRHLGHARSET